MSRAPSFCAVVLAAGESSRMGTDKALLPWPPRSPGASTTSNQTFLSSAIAAFSPFVDMVIVVAGANEPVLAPVVYANGGELVRNPEPARGQFSSLRVGLHEVLNRGRDAAMITLVDRPPVGAETLKTLLAAFTSAPSSETWAVIPEFEGQHGHPVVAGREMIEAFLRAPASATAREIQHEQRHHYSLRRGPGPPGYHQCEYTRGLCRSGCTALMLSPFADSTKVCHSEKLTFCCRFRASAFKL
jgi:molybdenum cofactor cytidylyltransferase